MAGAGTGVVNAIGLIADGLGIISFMQDNIPEIHPEGATVKIKAGLPELDAEDDSLGGSISHVYSYDDRNGFTGQADGCELDAGGMCTIIVDQPVAALSAGYVGVSNDNDATCISWITVAQHDGTDGGVWTGDIGFKCGASWYNSVEIAGNLPDSNEKYKPKCTWLDGDHTGGTKEAALKFNVKAHGKEMGKTLDDDVCSKTIFGTDTGPIAERPGKHKRDTKRGNTDRPPNLVEQLIVSNFTSQPAAELCNSATSWGPDFVGSDGMFCDMETKTLTPLCSTQEVEGCIDIKQPDGKLTKRMHVARRATDVVHKEYKKIQNWGG